MRLRDAFFERHLYYLVSERHAPITDHLCSLQHMSVGDVRKLLTEMLLGIKHVHSKGIVHRGIKLDGFFSGGVDGSPVQLGDFGSAAFLPKCGYLKDACGVVPYMSPEMVSSQGVTVTAKADMWSFGVTLYLLFCGNFPYVHIASYCGNSDVVKSSIARDDPPIRWGSAFRGFEESAPFTVLLVEKALPFLHSFLQRSEDDRFTAAEALKHQFLKPGKASQYAAFRDLRGKKMRGPLLARACKHAVQATSELYELCPSLTSKPRMSQQALDSALAAYREVHEKSLSRPATPSSTSRPATPSSTNLSATPSQTSRPSTPDASSVLGQSAWEDEAKACCGGSTGSASTSASAGSSPCQPPRPSSSGALRRLPSRLTFHRQKRVGPSQEDAQRLELHLMTHVY